MKTNLSSRGMILDMGSMRSFAKQLLGKGKVYEPVLKELLKEDFYGDPDIPMPTMKAISVNINLPYEKVRNYVWLIYRDLTDTEKKEVSFRIKNVKYGFNLLQRIDKLLTRAEKIFLRNYRKQNDRLALEALNSQRGSLELLAKISIELHKIKLLELDQKKMERLDVHVPLERLTKKEQDVYFRLLMKLMDDSEPIGISDYTESESSVLK